MREIYKRHSLFKTCRNIFCMLALSLIACFYPAQTKAQFTHCDTGCLCTSVETTATIAYINLQHEITQEFITRQFEYHQNWLFGANEFGGGNIRGSFWGLHMQPALMMMAEQLVTAGMEQMFILGTFFDSKAQLETQRLFQEKAAEAHKDYHPTFDMCVMGTTARGMAAADRKGELTTFILDQRSQDRQLGMNHSGGSFNSSVEREGRVRQLQARYCDPTDNSADLGLLCQGAGPRQTINKDIDYTRTVDSIRTLNLDFSDGTPTNDELDVLALASNLFSYNVLDKPQRSPLEVETGEGPYLDMRSIVAKRSVVENSFNTIIGLKSAGTAVAEETIFFTERVLEQLGIQSQDERLLLLGGTIDDGISPALRPSYYAQLETLAQRIYQDPEFFTNLYDKPANVLRKDVAMQAIGLMLDRDLHKNEMRSEMVLSIWLEMELMKYQNDLQNRLNSLAEKYEEN